MDTRVCLRLGCLVHVSGCYELWEPKSNVDKAQGYSTKTLSSLNLKFLNFESRQNSPMSFDGFREKARFRDLALAHPNKSHKRLRFHHKQALHAAAAFLNSSSCHWCLLRILCWGLLLLWPLDDFFWSRNFNDAALLMFTSLLVSRVLAATRIQHSGPRVSTFGGLTISYTILGASLLYL